MAAAKRKPRAAKPASAEPPDDSEVIEVPGYGRLTLKQKRFAEAYRQHGNGTRAAKEAGYEAKSDHDFQCIGAQLLRNVRVRWYLAFLGRDDDLTAGDVIDMLRGEATTADHAGARVRAQELLGKTRGMFDDVGNAPNRLTDDALVALIAGDDPAVRDLLLKRLKGE